MIEELQESQVSFLVTNLCKLSFNLEMSTSEFFSKLNAIGEVGITNNFERLSENVRVTLGELTLPSLSEEVLIRELWSRDTPLPILELTDTQQVEIVKEILLAPAPGNLTEELTDVVVEAFTTHCADTISTITQNYSLEEILEEVAAHFSLNEILTEMARHV
jgi:hypothetical protein